MSHVSQSVISAAMQTMELSSSCMWCLSVLNVGDRRRSRRGTGGKRPYHVNCILLGKYHVLINCRRSLHNSAQQLIFSSSSIHPFNLHLQRCCRRVVTWGALETLGSMWGLCDCVPVSYSIEKRRGAPAGNSYYYYYRYYYVCMAMIVVFFFVSCLVPPTSNNNNNQ